MITTLTNLIKAAAAVAISPAAVVADVLTLPSTAYEGRPAFGKTASLMQAAGRCAHEAVKPEAQQGVARPAAAGRQVASEGLQ
jgi:hypothetical protein